ncbi:MAG: glycosyltransferase [Methanobacterium sp.]
MSYVLITPFKDEEKNLADLKETVLNQTVKPLLWVMVDSNSLDNSFNLAKNLTENYEWIHVIKQDNLFEKGYGHINFAEAINEGYEHAKNLCACNGIKYDYIGKLDAAVSLENEYFEVLMEEMENNDNLAFTCGIVHFILGDNTRIVAKPSSKSETFGAHDIRLYRKNFFEEMKGYPLNYSPDTILLIKAINRKWDVKTLTSTYYEKKRLGGVGGSKQGVWSSYKLKGKAMYCLGYDMIFLFLNSFYISIKFPPHYQGFAIIHGYILSIINQDKKIDDKEIRDYFGKRISRILKSTIRIS